jgi:hypothetical protein
MCQVAHFDAAHVAVSAVGAPGVDAVVAVLRSSPYPPLRSIACSKRDGVLVLQGSVPSYYLKQVAQSLALGVNGSWPVQNEIEVVAAGDRLYLHGASVGNNLPEPRRPR